MSDLQDLLLTIDETVNSQKKAASSDVVVSHGVLEAGARLELWRDNVRIRNIVVPEGVAETTISLTGADWGADGEHEFSVRVVDATTGVAGEFSEAQAVLVDTRPPARASVISVSGDNKVNVAELGSTIPVVVSHEAAGEGFSLDILVGGTVVATVSPLVGATSTTVEVAASYFEAGGSFSVTARLTDAVGNIGSASSARTVTVVAEVPDAVTVGDLAGGDGLLSAKEKATVSTVTIAHEAAITGSKIEIWRDDQLVKSVSASIGATSTTIRLSGADWGAEGEHSFKVRLVDGAGNEGEWSDVQLVTVDTTIPGIATISSVAGDSYVNDAEHAGSDLVVAHSAAATGDILEVYVDRVLVKTIALTDAETTTTVELDADAWGGDGSHSVRVRVVDAAGNAGAWSASTNYVVDTAAAATLSLPVVARDDIVNAAEKAATTNIVVQHELSSAGAVIELARGEDIIKTITLNSRATSTTIGLTGDDWGVDGEHDLKVRYTDAAGNVGEWSDIRAVLVDSTAPDAPVIAALQDGGKVNAATKAGSTILTIAHGAASEGDVLELYRDSTLVRRITLVADAESTEITLTGSDWGSDGAHEFTARISDSAGNTGDWSSAIAAQVDTRAPTVVTIGTVAGDGTVTLEEQALESIITITHEAADAGAVLELYRDGVLWKTVEPTAGGTSSAIAIEADGWGDAGRVILTARLVDGSGNEGASGAGISVVVAGALPDAVTLSDFAGDNFVNAAEKRVLNTVEVTHAAALAGSKIELYRDNVLFKTAFVIEGSTTTAISLKSSDWGADGAYSFKARLVDSAGGQGEWSAVSSVIVDTSAPAAATLPTIAVDGRVNLAEKTAGVTFSVGHGAADAASMLEIYGNGQLITTVAAIEGETSTSVTLTGDDWGVDGTLAIRVRLVDQAGNIGAWSQEKRVIVDTVAAAAPVIGVMATDDVVSAREKASAQSIIITHEAAVSGSQIALYRDGDLIKTVTMSYGSSQTRVSLSGDDWGADGERSFTAIIIDAAGNESAESAERTVIVATSGPAIPAWDAQDGTLAGDGKLNATEKAANSAVTITHSAMEEGGKIEIYRDGVLVKSVDVVSGEIATVVELTGADWGADGTRTFKVRAVDAAGNISTFSDDQKVVVDSTPPAAPAAPTIGDGIINAAEKASGVTVRISHESASAGTVLEIRRGEDLVKTVTVSTGARTTAFSLSGDDWGTDGEKEFTFRLVDGAGNESAWSDATTVTVATAVPAAVTWGDVATDDKVDRAEKLAGVTVSFEHAEAESGSKLQIYRDGRLLKTVTLTEGATTTEVDFISSNWGADGVRTFTARIIAANGNAGEWSDEKLVAVGSVMPTAASITSIGDDWAIGAAEFSDITHITVSHDLAVEGAVIEIYRDNVLFKTFDATVGARETEVEIDPSEWGDNGTYSFKARFVDATGNQGAFSLARNVTVSLPLVLEAISGGGINAEERGENTIVTVKHAALGEGWTLNLYRGETLVATVAVGPADATTSFTLTGDDWGDDDTYEFTAQLEGPFGDFTRDSNVVEVVVDAIAPLKGSLSLGAISEDDTVTSFERLSVVTATVTHDAAEPGGKLVLFRGGVEVKTIDLVENSTSTVIELESDDLGDEGTYVFTVALTDAAGNLSEPSDGRSVTVQPATSLMDLKTANIGDTSALLMWDVQAPSTEGAAVTYRLYVNGQFVVETDDLAHVLDDLDSGGDYTVTVKVAENGVETAIADQITFETESQTPWDIAQIYSPYIDVGIGPVSYNDHLANIQNSGLKAVTLGFLVLTPEDWVDADTPVARDENNNPIAETVGLRWGEKNGSTFPDDMITETLSVKELVAELQSKNIDVTIALGGFSGSEPALFETDVSALTAIYQSIIDTYGVTHLDIDIEGASLNSIESGGYHGHYSQAYLTQTHINRIEALKAIKEANPGVSISFTVPVLPTGMLQNAVDMLQLVADYGFELDTLNIMAMDYGTGDMDQGWNAVSASINTIEQLDALGLTETKLGITPMIGINDVTYEVFTEEDALELMAFAQDNERVASLGIWSLGRDQEGNVVAGQGSSIGKVTSYGSGLEQEKYAFGDIFNELADEGAGYNPASGKVVISAIQTANGSETDAIINFSERNAVTDFVVNFPPANTGDKIQILRDGVVIKTINVSQYTYEREIGLSGSDWGDEGVHEFKARLVTSTGTTIATSDALYVTLDLTNPEVATLGAQAGGDNEVGTQEAVNGLALSFEHTLAEAGTKAAVYRNGVLIKTVTLAIDSTHTDVMLYAEEWGTVGTASTANYSVRIIDAAGNISGESNTQSIAVGAYATLQEWQSNKNYPTANTFVAFEGKVYKNAYYASLGEKPGDFEGWVYVEELDAAEPEPEPTELGVMTTGLTDTSMLVMWNVQEASVEGADVTYRLLVNGVEVAVTSDLAHQITGLTANTEYDITVEVFENGVATANLAEGTATTLEMEPWDISQIYSPYIDVGIGPVSYNDHLANIQNSGLKAVTLGFLVLTPEGWTNADTPVATDENKNPIADTVGLRWGETNSSTFPDDMMTTTLSVKNMVAELQGKDIEVTIALGGFSGSEPALFETDVEALTAIYQSIIDTYGVKHLDLDIEGASLNSIESGLYHGFYSQEYLTQTHLNRIEALKAIKAANPDVYISFTVPVLPTGLPQNVIDMLQLVADNGFELDTLNIMAMDYFTGDMDQGWNAIQASINTIADLDSVGLTETKLGITPMIGINDSVYEVFDFEDAHELMAFAKDNPRVASLGIWSLGRDQEGNEVYGQGSSIDKVTSYGSGIEQDKYAFGDIFNGVTDDGAGYNPYSGLTVLNTISGDNQVNATERTQTTTLSINHSAGTAGQQLKIFRDGTLVKTVSLATGTTETQVSMSGADWGSEGLHEFTAVVVTGSVDGTPSAAVRVLVDITAPGTPLVGAQAGGDNLVDLQEAKDGLAFSFDHDAAAAGTRANIYRDGVLIETVTLVAGATHTEVMLYGTDWGTPGVAATPSYTVTLVDLAGNSSSASAGHTITIDAYATVADWSPTAEYAVSHTYVIHDGAVYYNKWYASAGEEPGNPPNPESVTWELVETLDLNLALKGQSFLNVGDEDLTLSLAGGDLRDTQVTVSYIEGQTDNDVTSFYWVGGGEVANANDDSWANGDTAETQIAALASAGADVTLSFVAASNGDVAMGADNAAELAAELVAISNYYDVDSFDFLFTAADLANFSANEARHDLLNSALVLADDSLSGDLKISFTVAANQNGLTSNSIALLTNAFDSGVDLDILHVLSVPTSYSMADVFTFADTMIDGSDNIVSQLASIGFSDTKISITANTNSANYTAADNANVVNALSANSAIWSIGVWNANWGY